MRGHFIKNKRDTNEAAIFRIIRAHGFTIYPIDKPADALCGFRGVTFLVEIKNGRKAPLTDAQKKFLKTWEGQHVILCSEDEAIRWCQDIRARYSWKPET